MTIEFKTQLSRLRRQRQLSQADLAAQLYLSRQTISKWEQGETTPDLATLAKLAAILEVSLDELVLGTETNHIQGKPAPRFQESHHAMNGWEFLAQYWWTIIPCLGIIAGTVMALANH